VRLPVNPPVKPMLAKLVTDIPEGAFSYEPKWDGFRCVIFRDGDEVELGSRNERPLTRYFPEVVDAVLANTPERCVLDGEIIISDGERLNFEALQLRLHPAESRVRKLAAEIPAAFVAFDLLALGDESFVEEGFADRRKRLEKALKKAKPPVHITPATDDVAIAREWFTSFEGAGLDGIIAKGHDVRYRQDERVMFKVKHARTADCVVAGFRWHKSGPVVGSLLLGLYDDDGQLRHIGVAASFPMARRKELVKELEPYRTDVKAHPWSDPAGGHGPGGNVSRWNAGKDLSFEPMRPELVVEVGYDYMEGTRFRHTAQFKRWRPDRDAASCTFDQLERPTVVSIADVLAQSP
jgi:ATP-dependent DNA ligase